MASEKNHSFLRDVLNYYKNQGFTKDTKRYFMGADGDDIYASLLQKYGFKYEDIRQNLNGGITINVSRLINTIGYTFSSEAYATHLELGSWYKSELEYKLRNLYFKMTYPFKHAIYLIFKHFKIIR